MEKYKPYSIISGESTSQELFGLEAGQNEADALQRYRIRTNDTRSAQAVEISFHGFNVKIEELVVSTKIDESNPLSRFRFWDDR